VHDDDVRIEKRFSPLGDCHKINRVVLLNQKLGIGRSELLQGAVAVFLSAEVVDGPGIGRLKERHWMPEFNEASEETA
jgi:tRNA A37 threonylcarbamoyladenosine biosynthesis protein TsaE